SSLSRAFTDTGSSPTGISAIRIGLSGLDTSKTERRLSGVLTANKRVPSGERRMGLVCLPSKLTKLCADAAAMETSRARTTYRVKMQGRCGFVVDIRSAFSRWVMMHSVASVGTGRQDTVQTQSCPSWRPRETPHGALETDRRKRVPGQNGQPCILSPRKPQSEMQKAGSL